MVGLPAMTPVPAQCYQGTRKYLLPGTTTSHLLQYTRIRWPVAQVAKIKSQAPHKPLNAKRYGRVSSRYNLFQLLPLAICLFSLSSLKVQSCLVPSLHKKPAICTFLCICIPLSASPLAASLKHHPCRYRLSLLPLQRFLNSYRGFDPTSRAVFLSAAGFN